MWVWGIVFGIRLIKLTEKGAEKFLPRQSDAKSAKEKQE
jgi:hypothetical protein